MTSSVMSAEKLGEILSILGYEEEVVRRAIHVIYDVKETPETLEQESEPVPTQESESVLTQVKKTLKTLGIPVHIKGYGYLVDAIELVIGDRAFMNGVTKKLYPAIAKGNNTTPSRVERAIRHAIQVGWSRCDMAFVYEIFQNTVSPDRGVPTNSEFIALVAEYIAS